MPRFTNPVEPGNVRSHVVLRRGHDQTLSERRAGVRPSSRPCIALTHVVSITMSRAQIISISQAEKRGKQAAESRVLESTAGRPEYNKAIKVVQAAARSARQQE